MINVLGIILFTCLVALALFGLTTQTIRATGGYLKVIQGGPPNVGDYTQIRKCAGTVYPGRFMMGAGQTEGEGIVAAAGGADSGWVELVLYRTDVAKRQDADVAITSGQFVKTLRLPGNTFLVAGLFANRTTTTYEQGQVMMLEADGMLKIFNIATTTNAPSASWNLIHDAVARLAEASTQVSTTDTVELFWV